jgi:hypothetical protein
MAGCLPGVPPRLETAGARDQGRVLQPSGGRAARRGDRMDWIYLLILTVFSIELIVLGIAVYTLIYAAATWHQVAESNQRIAEMANRNERMTQSILQTVYDMQTQQ